MLFSTVPFLYVFLPAVLALYFSVPNRWKNPVLLFSSLFFYYYGEPAFCIIMVCSSLLGYGFGLLIGQARGTPYAKPVLWIAVLVCLAPLLLFKYSDFLLLNLNTLLRTNLKPLGFALPIGISFYTFQILSYLIDVYRGDAGVQKNPVSFTAYVTLFPQLIAGPIVRYQTIQDELAHRAHSLSDFSAGILRFCVGLGKKVLLADPLFAIITALSAAPDRSLLSFWLCAVSFTLQIYFDFSGYSDMAIGLGRMFGFHFPENFDHPYVSGSITEFWRRWHISLGSWFRDYVYIPLGGNRCSRGRQIFNILLVWFLTGFWHGAAWNFILWGLYFAALLLLEKQLLGKYLEKLPRPVRILYTMLLVVLGFTLFHADSLGDAAANLAGMFRFGALPVFDRTAVYYLLSNAALLLIAVIGATPLPEKLAHKLHSIRLGGAAEVLFCVGIVLLTTAYLVDGSFSPFLYFRF